MIILCAFVFMFLTQWFAYPLPTGSYITVCICSVMSAACAAYAGETRVRKEK